jgi:hypothetical protein
LYRGDVCPKLAGITTANRPRHTNNALLPVPHPSDLGMPHLLLQLEDTVHERLSGGWAARHVDIYGYNAVTTSCDRVAVVVVSSSICATTHRNNPSWIGHLIIDLSQGGCHLVCEGSGNNHDVGLSGRGTENDTETILIVSWSGQVHHLDSAARETESHGPERALSGPVGYLVERCQCILHSTLLSFLTRQGHLYSR